MESIIDFFSFIFEKMTGLLPDLSFSSPLFSYTDNVLLINYASVSGLIVYVIAVLFVVACLSVLIAIPISIYRSIYKRKLK